MSNFVIKATYRFSYENCCLPIYCIGEPGENWDKIDTYDIAKKLGMDNIEFKRTLTDKYNGYEIAYGMNIVYFKNKEDVEKVLEWIESIELAKKLGENK